MNTVVTPNRSFVGLTSCQEEKEGLIGFTCYVTLHYHNNN